MRPAAVPPLPSHRRGFRHFHSNKCGGVQRPRALHLNRCGSVRRHRALPAASRRCRVAQRGFPSAARELGIRGSRQPTRATIYRERRELRPELCFLPLVPSLSGSRSIHIWDGISQCSRSVNRNEVLGTGMSCTFPYPGCSGHAPSPTASCPPPSLAMPFPACHAYRGHDVQRATSTSAPPGGGRHQLGHRLLQPVEETATGRGGRHMYLGVRWAIGLHVALDPSLLATAVP